MDSLLIPSPSTVAAGEDRDATSSQRAIDAAIRCMDQLGLERTTVDDIARESGISRATLYRRFGNKEAIFAEALRQQGRPFEQSATEILTGAGSLAERIERLLVWGVLELPDNVLFKRMLNEETQTGMHIFNQLFRTRISKLLVPVFTAAQINRELREDLEAEFLVDWIIREMLLLKMATPWQEDALRKHIHFFIKPVLSAAANAPDPCDEEAAPLEKVDQRLTRLEQRLVEMHQLIGQLHGELKGVRNKGRHNNKKQP